MAEPRRTLRPAYLGLHRGHLWVFDHLQPTAVLLDPVSGAVVDQVSWPQLAPTATPDPFDPDGQWRIHISDAGVFVQQRSGPVAALSRDGLIGGFHSAGRTLTARSAHGLWCLPPTPRPDLAARHDAPPRFRGNRTTVRLIGNDPGPSRTISLDTPAVHTARSSGGDLYLLIEERTGARTSLGADSWIFRPATQWVRLLAEHPVPDQLERHELIDCDEPAITLSQRNAGRLGLWSAAPDHPRRRTEPAGGQQWRITHDGGPAGPTRHTLARTIEPDSADPPSPSRRIDLGPGTPVAVLGTDQHLWVAIEQPRLLNTYTRPEAAALVRVDVRTGDVTTVLPPASIDITDQSWPLGPAPIDAQDYAHYWQAYTATPMSNADRPLATGVRNGTAELVETWPDTAIHLTFDLDTHPGARLRRVVPLYDELGRPIPPEHAITHLWEQIETRQLPRPFPSASGYLDV